MRLLLASVAVAALLVTPPAYALTYQDIQSSVAGMTAVQVDIYKAKLIGKQVTWVGRVDGARRHIIGNLCIVYMDIDGGGYDARFDTTENIARLLRKGYYYKFTGTIADVFLVFGHAVVVLNNVKFLNSRRSRGGHR